MSPGKFFMWAAIALGAAAAIALSPAVTAGFALGIGFGVMVGVVTSIVVSRVMKRPLTQRTLIAGALAGALTGGFAGAVGGTVAAVGAATAADADFGAAAGTALTAFVSGTVTHDGIEADERRAREAQRDARGGELDPILGVTFDERDHAGGVSVTNVFLNGLGARAGLERGDVIFKVDGRRVADDAALDEALARAGSTAKLTINRVPLTLRDLEEGHRLEYPELVVTRPAPPATPTPGLIQALGR